MKKILVIIVIVIFSSCVEDAQETTRNGNFEVEFLFEQDGCKIYRFKDGTRYIYWANCAGKINSDYSTGGKNRTTVRNETIITK